MQIASVLYRIDSNNTNTYFNNNCNSCNSYSSCNSYNSNIISKEEKEKVKKVLSLLELESFIFINALNKLKEKTQYVFKGIL